MKKAKEIWVSLKNYEGIYEISNKGKIKELYERCNGTHGSHIVKYMNRDGRKLIYELWKDGKAKYEYINDLMKNTSFPEKKIKGLYKYSLKERKCEYCKKLFQPKIPKNIYCSSKCCQLYYKEKNSTIAVQYISRFIIFKRDEFRCIYCGRSSIENKNELHLEHIYPRSKGGNNNVNNLVTSCQTCNLEKSNMLLDNDVQERIFNVVKGRNKIYFKNKDITDYELTLDKFYKYNKDSKGTQCL